eukprot:EG_transcript_5877
MITALRSMRPGGNSNSKRNVVLLLEDAVAEYEALQDMLTSGLPLAAMLPAIKICESLVDQLMTVTEDESDCKVLRLLNLIQLQSNALQHVVMRHVEESFHLRTISQPTLVLDFPLAGPASGTPLPAFPAVPVRPPLRAGELRTSGPLNPQPESEVEQLEQLQQVLPGLSAEQAMEALRLTDHDARRAILLLLSEAEAHQPSAGPDGGGGRDALPAARPGSSGGPTSRSHSTASATPGCTSTSSTSSSSSSRDAPAAPLGGTDPSPRRTPPALSPAALAPPPPIPEAATPTSATSSADALHLDADASSPEVPRQRRRRGSRSKTGLVRLNKKTRKKSKGAKGKPVTPPPDLPLYPSEALLRDQTRMVTMLQPASAPASLSSYTPDPPCSFHSDSDLSPRGSQDPDRLPHTLPAREAAIVAGKERLAHRLRSLELEEVVMADDGNCQFRALAHQLCGSADYHEWVRLQVMEHLSRHREDYMAYFDGEQDLAHFLEGMANGEWGDEMTLRGFADTFGVVVHVVMSTGSPWCRTWEPADVTAVTRHVVLSYLSPVHYNSVLPTQSPLPPTPPSNPSASSRQPTP